MRELTRKLYRRGSSYETTIPMPLLFSLEQNRKYEVVFSLEKNRWFIDFRERREKGRK
ncbi:MAG: hypothetical protein NTV63_04750 [Candidatus Woesearchaeota archaeon]|nr:hypothetical protein [Candidatus Woesearchaeota archaeon]